MITEPLASEFRNRFQQEPEHFFFSPGRVNLIGEHIDYNGGNVLPCAISKGTYLAVRKNKDKRFRFQCLDFPETAELHLQESYSKTGGQWYNYPLGVINELLEHGHNLSGLDMLFSGNLPVGAGLSSSASIEVLTAFALSKIFGLNIERKESALLCQRVENKFIGVNCGIMDQFAVAMGKKNNALLLNCDTLEYEYLPFNPGKYALAIINTCKQRQLVASKYNERFVECSEALTMMRKKWDIESLCDLDPASFDLSRELINDPVLQRRAYHVVSENQRVKDAVIALQTGDIEVFGKLMYASHQSLNDNYEVTGPELNTIVDFCKTFQGCIGARMTGAGFGGCAIALIKDNTISEFQQHLAAHYQRVIGYPPEIFTTTAEEGVYEIRF
jgi:galactokinase